MQDWPEQQVRYLIHFDGSGSGMRFPDAALDEGDVLPAQTSVTARVGARRRPLRLAAAVADPRHPPPQQRPGHGQLVSGRHRASDRLVPRTGRAARGGSLSATPN